MTFRTFRPGVILGYPKGEDIAARQILGESRIRRILVVPQTGDSGKPRIGGTPKTRFPDGLPDLGPGGETGKSGKWARIWEFGQNLGNRDLGVKFGPGGEEFPPGRTLGRGKPPWNPGLAS